MLKRLARWVLREDIRGWNSTITTISDRWFRAKSDLERMTKHRDQLAEHIHAKGSALVWAQQQIRDQEKAEKGLPLQVFCPSCKIGLGDDGDVANGWLKDCPNCHSTDFLHSWEFEL